MANRLDPGFISRRQLRPDALAHSPVYFFAYEVTLPGHYEDLGGRRPTLIPGGVHIATTVDPKFAVQLCNEHGVTPLRTPEAWT